MTTGRKCTYCKSDKLRVNATGNCEMSSNYKYQIVCGECGATGPIYHLPIFNKTKEQIAIDKILESASLEVYYTEEECEKADKNKPKYIAANNVYLDLVAKLSEYVFGE